MRSWSVILGGQLSLTMCMLNLNFKILCEILVCYTGQSIIFDHVQAKSELSNSNWDPGQSYGRVNHLWPWACWILTLKFYVRSWSVILEGSIIFWPCACWILTLKFYVRSWSVILGSQSSLTMCRLNLNFQILTEILVSHMGGSIISDHVHVES